MNRSEKEAFISELHQGIHGAQAFALMSFNKIDVERMTAFRLSLRKRDVKVKVVKNSLAKRAFETTPFPEVAGHLEGPVLLVYGPGDPVVTAKAIWEWVGQENLDLKIKVAAALGKTMTSEQLKALSLLPGRSSLLAGFARALVSHPTRFLYALQDAPKRLGYALAALADLKRKQETTS